MSQQNINGRVLSFKVAADYSTKQYFLMMSDTSADNQVIIAGADAEVIGSLVDKPNAAGKAGAIAVGETYKVQAGDTVTRGDKLSTDSAGKAVTRTSETNVFAKALESGVAGQVIEVMPFRLAL